jgi:hypothetical protein
MTKPTDAELRDRFDYHQPDKIALEQHNAVNALFAPFAQKVRDICPDGRNLSLALTALEDARMRANAAIAVDGTAVRSRAAREMRQSD